MGLGGEGRDVCTSSTQWDPTDLFVFAPIVTITGKCAAHFHSGTLLGTQVAYVHGIQRSLTNITPNAVLMNLVRPNPPVSLLWPTPPWIVTMVWLRSPSLHWALIWSWCPPVCGSGHVPGRTRFVSGMHR